MSQKISSFNGSKILRKCCSPMPKIYLVEELCSDVTVGLAGTINVQSACKILWYLLIPGVPSSTEVGQEMDTLYFFLKSLMEANRAIIRWKQIEQ